MERTQFEPSVAASRQKYVWPGSRIRICSGDRYTAPAIAVPYFGGDVSDHGDRSPVVTICEKSLSVAISAR
uniref:Unannotated protein n=1 Tax=freshwater metagenome TaxID=449393 RepID=A0A6J7P043_9ZZZZ